MAHVSFAMILEGELVDYLSIWDGDLHTLCEPGKHFVVW